MEFVERLHRAAPDLELSGTWQVVGHRARTWAWPALQMGVAAAASWWLAAQAAGDAASYAPITAIVALGLGRERRLGRSAVLTSGLLLGVVAAEVATAFVGLGWWQVGVCMTLAALVAGAAIGRDLAVTYAAINAVVLLTTPGADGWFPSRLVAGLIGVATALAVLLVVAPARPVRLVERRLARVAERADDALAASATALQAGRVDVPGGGERPLIELARRLDDEIERSHATVDQATELVRWSPWRRRDATTVARLRHVARELRPAFRTASTLARLADRAVLLDVRAPAPLGNAIRRAGPALRSITADLVDDAPLCVDDMAMVSDVLERSMTTEVDRAVLVAMKEELRGLLADLDDIAETFLGDVPPPPDRLRSATVGDIDYGR